MMNRFFVVIVALALMVQLAVAMSQKDIKNILKKHNQYRAKHGVPALKWDKKAANFAQSTTNKCVFQHSGNSMYGENIAMGYGSWNQVVKAWYDEEKDYDYKSGDFSGATGHFTQVVWKGTSKIGCGFSKCNGQRIYSCNYLKPGNYIGEFQKNVFPPKSKSKSKKH